ncbi:hypothetical protein KCU80_g24259, partial [Aureobasidium melanogenum]
AAIHTAVTIIDHRQDTELDWSVIIMRIRIRGPSGMSQVNMLETATWGELKHEISTKTSVADFDVKYGYPPQNLDTTSIDNETKLADVGIKLDGEQLIILPRDVQQSLHNPMS